MADHDPKLLATLGVGVRVANRYVICRVLGKGGMGHVFEVENDAIGRRFALKVLSLSFAGDEAIKRFRREAKALGRISSPRVAQVIDFDVDPAVGPFLVMELLDGETLQQRLARQGRMAPAAAVTLAIDLCEALAEVHASGIVHRDLKPSNIGLTKSGTFAVKLLDFGLAASVDEAFTERLTQSQQFLGTLPYMAPELFHGHPPTQALDLYALGAVIYEMIAGRTPFVASNPAQYVAQHLASEVPAIETVAPGTGAPAWLEEIVRRLLAKEARDRYATAAAVAKALRDADGSGFASTMSAPSAAISGAVSTSVGRAPARRGPPLLAIGLVLLVVGGVAAAVMALRSRPASVAPTTATATPSTVAPPPSTLPPTAVTPPVAAPPVAPVLAPPPPKTEAPKASSKHTPHKSATKKPRSKSWNGEILEE